MQNDGMEGWRIEMKQGIKRGLWILLAIVLVLAWMPAVAAAQAPISASGQETLPILSTDEAVEQFLLGQTAGNNRSFAASANQLQLIRKQVSPGGETSYLYQQLYRDVPVYGKYAKLRLDKLRRPVFVDNDLAPELGSAALPTVPSVSKQQAVDALVRAVEAAIGGAIDRTAVIAGKQAFYGEAEQMLYPHHGEYRLAYRVTVSCLVPEPGSWVGFVDAADGTVLDKYGRRSALSADNAVSGKGRGHATDYDDVRAYYDADGWIDPDNPGLYYLLDVTRAMFDPDNAFDPGMIATYVYEPMPPEWEAVEGFMYLLTSSETDTFDNPEALDAHVQLGDVYEFFLGHYGWNSYNGLGSTVTSVVYFDHEPDNAFWVSGLDMMVFGKPDQSMACIACSADVVAHEFAHGVIDYTAGLEYRNQSGALNESYADIFAAVFSRDGNPWLIGEATGNPIRNLANPAQYGQPMHMDDYAFKFLEDDNGGVHTNSGIPNHAAYLIARDIDNSGLDLAGLDGRQALGHIAFGSLFYLTPLDEFHDARWAYSMSALDFAQWLELDDAQTDALLNIVNGAWAAVGITDSYAPLNIREVVTPYEWLFLTTVDEGRAIAYVAFPIGYPKADLRMQVLSSFGTTVEPQFAVFDEEGEASVKVTDGTREKWWTIQLVELPALYYSGTSFAEAGANDGSIGNAITITLQGDKFSGIKGEDFVRTNKIHVENVPAGLTARAIRTSATELRLQLDGKAQYHAAADSSDGMWISFEREAFQNADGDEPIYYQVFWTIAEFDVAFDDPAPAVIGGGPFIPPAPETGKAEATDDGVVIRLDQPEPRTNSDGQSSIDVVLDERVLSDGFALLAEQADAPNVLRIPIDAMADVYEVSLPASAIRQGFDVAEDIRLSIETEEAAYEVPLAAFTQEQLAGGGQIAISIRRVGGETKQTLITRTSETRMRLLGDAYDFEITVTKNGTDTEIRRFARPLIRSIAVEGRPGAHVAVVRFDPASGRFAFVPATFTHEGGKTIATFSRSSNSIYAVVGYTPVFRDAAGHWANRDIEQLALRQVVSGVTADTFQPNARVTRAQFAAMLANALDIDAPGAGSPASGTSFKDVAPSAWYAAAVAAGVDAGLFSGFADGTFRPNETITREQMAAMLANAMAYAGLPAAVTGSPEAVLARFADREAISDWAASSIATAVQSGLLFGNPDGRFAPADPATRAEAAAILTRLLHALEQ